MAGRLSSAGPPGAPTLSRRGSTAGAGPPAPRPSGRSPAAEPSRSGRWRCAFARQAPRALATVEWALHEPGYQVGTPLPSPPGDWEARGHRLEASRSPLRPLGVTLDLTGSSRAAPAVLSTAGSPGHTPSPPPRAGGQHGMPGGQAGALPNSAFLSRRRRVTSQARESQLVWA